MDNKYNNLPTTTILDNPFKNALKPEGHGGPVLRELALLPGGVVACGSVGRLHLDHGRVDNTEGDYCDSVFKITLMMELPSIVVIV